jgi:GT2 family glycosyltransferase
MYHEEVDYLYRAARKGYPVFFCPFAEARHHGAYSTRHQPLQRVYWVRRNTVYFLRKHRPGWWGWAYFWLTLALSLGFNLCRCRFERVKAILTGLTDGMGMRVAQPSPLQVSTGSAAVRTASETLAPRGLDQAGGKCGQAPDVSFVIPCFNSRSTIGTTIDSIMRQSSRLNLETIVVDSSDDDTVELLRKDWPQVRVVHSPVRLFPGAARNRGAELAGGRLIAFVDADAAVQPGWLERLCSALEARPSVTMTGGAVGNANPRPLPSRVLHLVEFSEYLPGLAPGLRRALSSSNLLVRRDDFLSSRRFAEDYAMAEDLLLCQAWSGGILFESRACVLHRHRSTWTRARRHLYELGWWSGRYRGERASRDRWLSAAPGLSLLLPWIRTLLICSRLVRSGGPTAWGGLFLAPLIWGALLWWAVGLHRGLKDGLRRRRASAVA